MRSWKVTQQLPDGRTLVTYRDPREVEGELLWPSRINDDLATKAALILGPYAEAQLEQNPVPATGGIIKQHWLKYWSYGGQVEGTLALPPHGIELSSWDCSFKGLDDSDYVCGGSIRRAHGHYFVLADLVWDRLDFPTTLEQVVMMCVRNPLIMEKIVEAKANGSAVVAMLQDKIPGFEEVEPLGGKEARCNAVAPLFKAGLVVLPHPSVAEWTPRAVNQLVRFPKAINDDFVDMITQGLIRLYSSNLLADAMEALGHGSTLSKLMGGK